MILLALLLCAIITVLPAGVLLYRTRKRKTVVGVLQFFPAVVNLIAAGLMLSVLLVTAVRREWLGFMTLALCIVAASAVVYVPRSVVRWRRKKTAEICGQSRCAEGFLCTRPKGHLLPFCKLKPGRKV